MKTEEMLSKVIFGIFFANLRDISNGKILIKGGMP